MEINLKSVCSTVQTMLKPECVDGRFLDYTKPADPKDAALFSLEKTTAVLSFVNGKLSFKPEELSLEKGLYAALRLTYCIAIPYFASYFAWYNLGCFALNVILAGIIEHRKNPDDGTDFKQLATNAMIHLAYAVYNCAAVYFSTAAILYLPVLAVAYAVCPDKILNLYNALHTHKDPNMQREQLLIDNTAAFVDQESNGKPKEWEKPAAVKYAIKLKKHLKEYHTAEVRGAEIEGYIPKYVRKFMDSLLRQPPKDSKNPIHQRRLSRWLQTGRL